MSRRHVTGLAAAAVLLAGSASAQPTADAPRFAGLFSDHAVLQRDAPLTLWGEARPGARLTVSLADQTLVARADDQGRWRVKTTPLMAGGPYRLQVRDDAGNGTTLDDIMVGDVWLCSGQSNMEFPTGAATNAWNEIQASANPNLRFANIGRDAEPHPQARLKTAVEWKVAGPKTTGQSSAVCYYMAKALQQAEKVPVGFVNSSWGGTPAEAWIPEPTLRGLKRYDAALDLLDRHATDPSAAPKTFPVGAAGLDQAPWEAMSGLSVLYNGMIAPLTPYRFKGVAWYQGESNWKTPDQYQGLLTALIADWRTAFGQPDLPFLVVQLPAFGAPAATPVQSSWPQLREAERRTVLATPGTGLTVTVDVGDRFDIHPTQKSVVGQRLALAARRVAYGETVPASPTPQKVERRGADLVVTFADADKGLVTYSSHEAIGFEACTGASAQKCRFVTAVPDGDTVVLKGANAPDVRLVRYAWADAPFVNLFNSDDLPAAPFEMAVP